MSATSPRILLIAALAWVGLFAGSASAQTTATSTASTAPRCVPSALNRSDVLPGTSIEASPLPDSLVANPRTQISLLGVPSNELANVTVSGSRSGSHPGRLEAYSQGDGASFVPNTPFTEGERVTVTGDVISGGHATRWRFGFTVDEPDPIPTGGPGHPPAGTKGDVQHFVSRPDLTPPTIWVTTDSPEAAPGYIMTAPYSGPGQHGPMIFDSTGQLVWFDPLPANAWATNLQVQQYEGKPVLTFWQGYIPPEGFGEGEEIIVNSAYQVVDRVQAGNGLMADLHDFEIEPDDTALLTVFNPIHCDLSAYGGPSDMAVTDGVFQQIDLKTGLVMRQWDSVDHVPLSNSYQSPTGATLLWPWDAFHINSLQAEPGGGILISSRSTWAVYQLDGRTGQISWELGGKHSSFRLTAGVATAWQHDATLLPNDTITEFDNGGVPKVESQSRAIEVSLDIGTRTATLVHQFTHPTPLLAGSQGNYQTLVNGDAFVGWGSQPYFSEYSPAGQLVFDAHMAAPDQAYRSYRFPWTGTPARPPDVAARPLDGKLVYYTSWNGATGVASWKLYAGTSATTMKLVGSAPRTGFETRIPTTAVGPYVQVQAVSSVGGLLGTSAVVKASS